METSSFWSCHVWVTAATLHKLKQNHGGERSKPLLSEGRPHGGEEFSLDDVRSPVCTTQKVTIPPFSTVSVHTNSGIKGCCMCVHVLTEPMPGPQLPAAVVPVVTYRELHLGSSRVPICLHNLSTHTMEIPTKTVFGQVAPANQVPLVVHPMRTIEESNHKTQKG